MTHKISTLFTLLIFANTLFAQQKEGKATGKEKTLAVPLQKFPDKGFPENTYPIAEIRFVQVVPDSTRLGYLQNSRNTKVTAIPDMQLTNYFQSYINKKYESSYNKDGLHFLWVLKNIRVGQRSFAGIDRAYLYFNAAAYCSRDGDNYNFLTSLDTVLVIADESYGTSLHYNNIREALRLLLYQSIDRGSNFAAAGNNFSVTQIVSRERERFNFPIYTDSTFREGAYANFKEFINNAPSITDYKTVVMNKNETVIIGGEKDTITPWGICKKGELYKYYSGSLVSIEKQSNEFVLSDYVAAINRRNTNIANVALFGNVVLNVAGGIAGRFLATRLSDGVITVTSIPYIKKKQPEACTINMETGDWFF